MLALVLIGFISLYNYAPPSEIIHWPDLHQDDIGPGLARLSCLLDKLPEGVDTYGFLPALPRRMEDPLITPSTLRVRSADYQAYYLVEFALAPRVISFYDSKPWIIANYPDQATGLEAIQATPFKIVFDCGNGVFLVRK
jgi:hypothetical protein